MRVRLFCNRALIWCLAGTDYEMPELGSDDLVLGIQTLSVEPHCSALMCLDSRRLPSCAQNPHNVFLKRYMNCFVELHHHWFKKITTAHVDSLSVRISSGQSGAQQTTECREARRCLTQPQLT
ncbi:hypothetical protein M9H77_23762 [Catharanthus roseus]|uniref:Uncharacterized protein n=1 Tax=Catharanthus roseus TaxID=4058 RepID=A0ACC0AWD7_CATRO|nr:hypothetical protein M9H77_23762 [Catharanthus roseus]